MKRSNLRKIHRELYQIDKAFKTLANPDHLKSILDNINTTAYLQKMCATYSNKLTTIVDELEEELEPKDD